jgi:hypothetical protein
MKVSTGSRVSGIDRDRQVSLTITGLNNIDYARTSDVVMNVPFSRMGDTMRRVSRMGGKIVGVSVSTGVGGADGAAGEVKDTNKAHRAKKGSANKG